MARGALKSDIKPMQYAFMNSPDYAKGVIKRDDNYKHRADAETLFRRVMQADAGPALGRFAVALKAYQKADHNVEKGHKARKAELIDAFLTIPKEFRDLISTKADAKGLVNGEILMRGGRHRANPDDSGRITASFTTDNMTAANFGYRKYTLEKDVKSYGGIIDTQKVASFQTLMVWGASGNKYEPPYNKDDPLGKGDIGGMLYRTFNPMEREYIVYGIEWKPLGAAQQ